MSDDRKKGQFATWGVLPRSRALSLKRRTRALACCSENILILHALVLCIVANESRQGCR